MQHSASRRVDRASTSSQMDNRRSEKCEGQFRGLERSCFRACRGGKSPRRDLRDSVESSSTQTWEPWVRTTCVSKSRLSKSNRILICARKRNPEYPRPCNDGYDLLSEFKNLFNDRGKIFAEAKTSTTVCKRDAYSVCEAVCIDRVFAELGLQTDVGGCKSVTRRPSEDRAVIEDPKPENKDSEATPKSGLPPGPSSSKPSKPSKAKRVNLRGKISTTVKKRGVPKVGARAKAEKKRSGTSGSPKATKPPVRVEADCATAPKKSRDAKAKGKKVVLATRPASIIEPGTGTNGVNKTAAKQKKLEDEEEEVVFAGESKTEESAEGPADVEVRPESSSKFEDVPQRRISDPANSRSATQSSSSSLKKQFENGSMTSEIMRPAKLVGRRQTAYQVNGLSALKSLESGKGSSTLNSSEGEEESESAGRRKGSNSSASKSAVKKTGRKIMRKHKSGEVRDRDSISTDESEEKFNTPIHGEDQSRSCDPGKLDTRKSPMMIWQWLRERYGSPFLKGSNDRCSKDPFLSLLFSCSYGDSEIECKNFGNVKKVR